MSRETSNSLIQQLANGSNVGTVNDRAKNAGTGTLTTHQGHPVTNNQFLLTSLATSALVD